MRNVVLACMSAIVAFRAMGLIYYYTIFPMSPAGWLEAARATTVELAQGTESDEIKAKARELYDELAHNQLDASMLGGTIAAAAWSVIFVVDKPDEPASRLSGVSVGLLFLGAVVLIAGPILAREGDRHFGLLLREAAIYVGFNAILFSFCSMAIELASTAWGVVALAIVVCATIRELRYCRVQWQRISDMEQNRMSNQNDGEALAKEKDTKSS
ncbi:hypothetical protein OG780_12420 [Streptomyces sp. NBC_00386]|uniref:hypothetical protein n=1 Tax=Streptomyces sp. NBC_00386 TaxID=2975734 RepID=UPI002E219AB6